MYDMIIKSHEINIQTNRSLFEYFMTNKTHLVAHPIK